MDADETHDDELDYECWHPCAHCGDLVEHVTTDRHCSDDGDDLRCPPCELLQEMEEADDGG